MNLILNQKYSHGNTPIRPEEAEQLIPRISTMGELNEYEALNIVTARAWAFDDRTMKSMDPLEEPYIGNCITACSTTFGNGQVPIVRRSGTSVAIRKRSCNGFPSVWTTHDIGLKTKRSRTMKRCFVFTIS